MTVAEPMEVVRWARQFGEEAEILDISALSEVSQDEE